MSETSLSIDFHGEELLLHPEGAIWWSATRSLILSDVHLGKSATFRAHGVAIPEGENREDLDRITKLVDEYQATTLLIVGDFLHSRSLPEPGLLEILNNWIQSLSCQVTLILGNHDPAAKRLTEIPTLKTAITHQIRGITLVHDPADAPAAQPTIAGHLHPLCRIGRKAGPKIRVPCFYLKDLTLILPAFGTFTSGSVIEPKPATDRCYAIVGNRVLLRPPWR